MKPILFLCIALMSCGTSGGIQISTKRTSTETEGWNAIGGGWDRASNRAVSLTFPLKLAWTYSATSAVASSIVVQDGLVYFSTKDGRVCSLTASDGKLVGRIRYVHAALGGPTVHGTSAFYGFAAGKRTYVQYDLLSGTHKHASELGMIETNPVVLDDLVYVGGLDGTFYCMNAGDGTVTWKYRAAKPIRASAGIMVNDVYFACDSGKVYCLNRFNGKVSWIAETGAAIVSTPVSDGKYVFAGNTKGDLMAFARETGKIIWQAKIENPAGNLFGGIALGTGLIYVGSTNGVLYAIEKETGRTRWRYRTAGAISTTPIVTREHVLVGSQDSYFYAFDARTGESVWKYKTEGRIRTNPALYGTTLIIASENNEVYAFHP